MHSYYGGPNYETVTELRAMALLGADSVSMSIASEVSWLYLTVKFHLI